jgi:DNA polymerase delta subunit 1
LTYLLKRAKFLGINHEFCFLSRIKDSETKFEASVFESKAYGKRESNTFVLPGRIDLDVFIAITRDYKLRSYSLNAVSIHFLKEQKEDVHHSKITGMWQGSDEERERLAKVSYFLVPIMFCEFF